MTKVVRIATRKSPLALWQAEHVKQLLLQHYQAIQVELITFTTEGDRFLDKPLIDIGGKGLFLKELEEALLQHQADIAVHSMKDVPVALPEGLTLSTILKREDPRDALVNLNSLTLNELPEGAIIGTASLRRGCQLLRIRPDFKIKPVRGNVGTRLSKLKNGEYDALVLASAGLKRLALEARISHLLTIDECLPAVGQGAIGIECRQNDEDIQQLLAPLACPKTTACVLAERSMNALLGGSCHVPIAGHATLHHQSITMKGLLLSQEGKQKLESSHTGAMEEAMSIGKTVGESLIAQGAVALMDSWTHG